ncbi:hypothetical protein cyc_04343 [Cyclospora cayetanensis]|uniref:Ice-structuring glycoprotein-like n=1 Tax=Cyclospora cayetanensis TaxID=88456 RepID=A0A1D3D1I1_9EIME|nr:hypothetical protein cyc_04343 [Cyclospora cayetanensis]
MPPLPNSTPRGERHLVPPPQSTPEQNQAEEASSASLFASSKATTQEITATRLHAPPAQINTCAAAAAAETAATGAAKTEASTASPIETAAATEGEAPYTETEAAYAETEAAYAETEAAYAETEAPYTETEAAYAETEAAYTKTEAPCTETEAAYAETEAKSGGRSSRFFYRIVASRFSPVFFDWQEVPEADAGWFAQFVKLQQPAAATSDAIQASAAADGGSEVANSDSIWKCALDFCCMRAATMAAAACAAPATALSDASASSAQAAAAATTPPVVAGTKNAGAEAAVAASAVSPQTLNTPVETHQELLLHFVASQLLSLRSSSCRAAMRTVGMLCPLLLRAAAEKRFLAVEASNALKEIAAMSGSAAAGVADAKADAVAPAAKIDATDAADAEEEEKASAIQVAAAAPCIQKPQQVKDLQHPTKRTWSPISVCFLQSGKRLKQTVPKVHAASP